MAEPQGTIDFFISYRGQQAAWARWVNWVVRSLGFSTRLMDEFQVGTTWTSNMRRAAQDCRRLIPLYSAEYWASGACVEEFDAYWRQHLQNGTARFLLPFVVEDSAVPDMHVMLLARRMFNLSREAASDAILDDLKGIDPVAAMPVYGEPEPPFPGTAQPNSGLTSAPAISPFPVKAQPPRPGSAGPESAQAIQRKRDISNINWLLSNMHLPTLDQMIEELPAILNDRALYLWEGVNGIVNSSLFHLYDDSMRTAAYGLHRAWETCVSHGAQYHAGPNSSIYLFRNQLTDEQEAAWQQIESARLDLRRHRDNLLREIRAGYLEVDLDETNRAAWEEYTDSQRETKARFERGEA